MSSTCAAVSVTVPPSTPLPSGSGTATAALSPGIAGACNDAPTGGPLKPLVVSVQVSTRVCLSSEACRLPVALLSFGGTMLAPDRREVSVVLVAVCAAACRPQASRLHNTTAL